MPINVRDLQDFSKIVDHSACKLGRDFRRLDLRTLRIENYLARSLAPAPAEVDWTVAVKEPYGDMGNTLVGDCTFAAFGHAVQVWTANSISPSGEITIPTQEILAGYSTLTGYRPGVPSTDQGANELDVLKFLRSTGVYDHKILGFASVDPANLEAAKKTIQLLGGTYIGLALPLSAQHQNVWDVVDGASLFARLFGKRKSGDSDPGSWGGHAVWVPSYNALGPVCVTWGALKQMTWEFWRKYCDEAYALASNDWLTGKIDKLVGVNVENWRADVTAVASLSLKRFSLADLPKSDGPDLRRN